jgi:hypothetical protein
VRRDAVSRLSWRRHIDTGLAIYRIRDMETRDLTSRRSSRDSWRKALDVSCLAVQRLTADTDDHMAIPS